MGAVLLLAGSLHAQDNFTQIVSILQSNCTGYCHNQGNPTGNLDFTANQANIYAAIVNATPDNATAASSGSMRVSPGYPERSFLLKKLIHNLDSSMTLASGEGDPMPQAGTPPTEAEVELIRQWILHGAQPTGTAVDYQLVQDYYNGQGKARKPAPAPPAAGEGFQLHLGPILIAPQTEIEYYKKEDIKLSADLEVKELNNFMDDASHHLILYKYHPNADTMFGEGLREVGFLTAADMNFNASYVSTWQYEKSHELPEGTAYFWAENTVLDMNYHILNYSPDSIMAAEVYVNVYTQPAGTADKEMKTSLSVYSQDNPFALNILNNAQDTTYVMEQMISGSSDTIDIWLIQGHTHRLGKDYDIFLRNEDGSKGDQIYEGFFDQDYAFNTGSYDWEHPPVREFSPLLPVSLGSGLIHEAIYFNDGPSPVSFGLTTQDEMFITYYQYTSRLSTDIEEEHTIANTIKLYPNPAYNHLYVQAPDKAVNSTMLVQLYNMVGQQVMEHNTDSNLSKLNVSDLKRGFYIVQVTIEGKTFTNKFIKE